MFRGVELSDIINSKIGFTFLLILPIYSIDIKEFGYQSTVAMINSSPDITHEFAINRSGSPLIQCATLCAQSSACVGTEICDTKPKRCRLWGEDFTSVGASSSAHYCSRYAKKRTNNRCPAFQPPEIRQTITLNGEPHFAVFYSKTHTWIIIQRRRDGSQSFFKTWWLYGSGFGSYTSNSEFWRGNHFIHLLTSIGYTYLRIDLMDHDGVCKYAEYSTFIVDNKDNRFRLTISGYSGDAGDSMTYHNGMNFSAYDNDWYGWSNPCATKTASYGGFWYRDSSACHMANPNGDYGNTGYKKGINWYTWHGFSYSLKEVRMMVRKP